MLSCPEHGWTEITIGDFISYASYIQDIPVLFLEAFIRALAYGIPAEIQVDEEGSSFTLRSHHTTTITVHRKPEEIHHFNQNVGTLAQACRNDLLQFWQAWLEWPPEAQLLHGKERDVFLENRSAQLTRLIRELDKHLL